LAKVESERLAREASLAVRAAVALDAPAVDGARVAAVVVVAEGGATGVGGAGGVWTEGRYEGAHGGRPPGEVRRDDADFHAPGGRGLPLLAFLSSSRRGQDPWGGRYPATGAAVFAASQVLHLSYPFLLSGSGAFASKP
jgi:hypothetical protein